MTSAGEPSGDAELPKYGCPIFRVPEQIRKIMPGAFDPTKTSFGPYHHEPERCAAAIFKREYITKLLTRIENTGKKWDDIVFEVGKIKDQAKAFYYPDENFSKLDDESFVDVMVRDGCVLAEVCYQIDEHEWGENHPIRRDMMLLENQIPFIVLEKIWGFLKTKDLVNPLLWNMWDRYSPNGYGYPFPITRRPLHLLHLLSLAAFRQTPAADPDAAGHENPPALAPGVVNLLKIGVEVKKNEYARGLEVSFSNGVITMNPLKITENTGKYLANLIAFEQCYVGATLGASNYVVLMNSLVQTPADAALLSSDNRGILVWDQFGGIDADVDADVAGLFKELRRGIRYFKEDPGCNPRVILDWIRKPEESFLTIFRVPGRIRDLNPNAYEPTIISFGPYHLGNERLKYMDRKKWTYLDDLFKREGFGNKNWDGCLEAVRAIQDLSRYYKDFDELDGSGLAEVMVLDGCFQIQFMMLASEGREEIGIERDMMLLENQIPFIVLQKISEYLGCWARVQKNLHSFVKSIYSPNSDDQSSFPQNPLHLVDLLRLEMFPPQDFSAPAPHSGSVDSGARAQDPGAPAQDPGAPPQHSGAPQGPNSPVCGIPGLAELRRKGVKFVRGQNPGLKVFFENGEMSISPHKIQRNTEVYLHNVIAFEQCFIRAGKEASNYVVLMNYLIGKPGDVAVLTSRKTGILDNNLASEEEVVHLFKNLSTGIFAFRGGSIYGDISRYVGSRRREWMTEFWEKYFNSPWSYVAFCAAVALLVLTFLQTFYSIKSYVKSST